VGKGGRALPFPKIKMSYATHWRVLFGHYRREPTGYVLLSKMSWPTKYWTRFLINLTLSYVRSTTARRARACERRTRTARPGRRLRLPPCSRGGRRRWSAYGSGGCHAENGAGRDDANIDVDGLLCYSMGIVRISKQETKQWPSDVEDS
jgi:hypothetical protein